MKKLFDLFSKKTDESEPTHIPSIPNVAKSDTTKSFRRLSAMNKSMVTENLYDNMAFVIFCPKHNSIAICKTEHVEGSVALWLPFISLEPTIGWKESLNEGMSLILSDKDTRLREKLMNEQPWEHCILHLDRVQLPQTQRFITRLISLARIQNKSPLLSDCCRKTSRITWVDLDEIKKAKYDTYWGPEVYLHTSSVKCDMADPESYQTESEIDLNYILKYAPRSPPQNEEEYLLQELNVNEKRIERLYIDFTEHCFPALKMTFPSFKNYLLKYGHNWDDIRMKKLFAAFNFLPESKGRLDFQELLMGLACIEPEAPNGKSRIKFVFRYYDANKDGFLTEAEFRNMVIEINPYSSLEFINEKVREWMRILKATANGVSFPEFNVAVGSRKFRGTSNLCRAVRPIFEAINNAMASRAVRTNTELKKTMIEHINKKVYEGVCKNCRKTRYEINPIIVKIGIDGKYTEPQLLTENVLKKQLSNPPKNHLLSQKYTTDVMFNPKHLANYLREEIRAFNAVKGTREQPKGVFSESKESRETFVKNLEELAKEVIPILEAEDRCVKLSSPAVVIGDIHGNLEDLLSIEKCIFKGTPMLTSNYVFLGDYVDRGKWSVECAVYILCLKLLAPTNFIVLRGNHETRVLQKMYTFLKECQTKYGSFGGKVFETLNRIFDRLPLAAVIDDSIFCCHGGIPTSASTIKDINKINPNLSNVEEESSIAWEMLWNDPVDKKEFKQTIELLKKREDISSGFVPNQRRGTAYFFNEFACQEFLKTNDLSHVIRAHEVPVPGFRFHFDKKCLTIFSCSHYMGQDNIAAVVHIANQTLRIVALDTKDNPSATDESSSRRKNQ